MKDNKLIAEFMGGIPSSVPNLINLPQTIGQSSILCVKGSEGLPSGTYKVKRINDLKYHSSWDWLMFVVEKIESMKADFKVKSQWNEFINETIHQVVVKIEKGTMSKDRRCIYDKVKVYDYIGEASSDKKKAIYKAVVEFIKNYKNINKRI